MRLRAISDFGAQRLVDVEASGAFRAEKDAGCSLGHISVSGLGTMLQLVFGTYAILEVFASIWQARRIDRRRLWHIERILMQPIWHIERILVQPTF